MDRFSYADHSDLLDQVATSEEEAREVRRILTGVVPKAHVWPSCCGECSQGRRLCPTPEACQVSIDPDPPREAQRGYECLAVIALLLVTWAAIAATLVATLAR